jgi:hypothetical protein
MVNFDKLKLNFNIFDFKNQKIKNEITDLIEELNIDEIPTRETIITEIYYNNLPNYDVLNFKANSRILEINRKKSKNEILKENFEKLKNEKDNKNKVSILKNLFALFDSIASADKEVLISTLSVVNYDEIKTSIDNLLITFPLDQ